MHKRHIHVYMFFTTFPSIYKAIISGQLRYSITSFAIIIFLCTECIRISISSSKPLKVSENSLWTINWSLCITSKCHWYFSKTDNWLSSAPDCFQNYGKDACFLQNRRKTGDLLPPYLPVYLQALPFIFHTRQDKYRRHPTWYNIPRQFHGTCGG